VNAWGEAVRQGEDGRPVYPCPVCAEPLDAPCDDAFLCAALALCERGSYKAVRHASGEQVDGHVLATALLVDAAWPTVLDDARRHGGDCPDPLECDVCCLSRSVLQLDAWFWQTRAASLG